MINKVHVLNLKDNNTEYTDVSIVESQLYLGERGVYKGAILEKFNIVDLKMKDIKDKSFYRYPKLSLPRMKVDLLKEKSNISITRKQEDADYLIISTKFIESISDYSWSSTYSGKDLLYNVEKNTQYFTKDAYTKIKKILEDNIDDLFVIKQGWSYSRVLDITNDIDYKTSNYLYVPAANIELFNELLACTNLVLDSNINNLIYEDMHILTKEEYLNARNMIKSQDIENRALVLELLSNCNLTKSFDYVSLLFYFYYDHLKDAKNWNSVNVKTLRESLSDFQPGYSNTTYGNYYDNYLKKLIEHDQFTEFAFKEVARYTFHNVLKRSMNMDDESVFIIDMDAIKINPAYLSNLKQSVNFLSTPLEIGVSKF